MHVREVVLDRDVRSQRLLPARTAVFSVYFARRTASVLTLIAIDGGAFILALTAAAVAKGMTLATPWPGLTWQGVIVIVACVVTVAAGGRLYGRRPSRHRAGRLFLCWTIAWTCSSVLMLAVDTDGLGARLVAVWLLAFALSFSGRWLFDALLILRYGAESEWPRVVLVGGTAACANALVTLAAQPPAHKVNVVGIVALPGGAGGDLSPSQQTVRLPRTYETLARALRTSAASEVVIADPAAVNGHLRSIMGECCSHGVALKAIMTAVPPSREKISYVPGLDCPMFLVRPKPAGWGSYFLKRVGDRVGATVLLIVLSPLLLGIALIIKFTSAGPVLFADRRVGIGQRLFHCYKFRTMVAGAQAMQGELEELNEAEGALFKLRHDPRVTAVGRVLRRFSLDELPQLLNVVKGDMSLVGPRPLPVRDNELMEEWHRQRHVVLPGITGLWQAAGRSDLGFDEMLALDLRYIDTWSLRGDVQILWRTVGAVVSSRGAH